MKAPITWYPDGYIVFWSTHRQQWVQGLPRRIARQLPQEWVDSLSADERAQAIAHEIACGVHADIIFD